MKATIPIILALCLCGCAFKGTRKVDATLNIGGGFFQLEWGSKVDGAYDPPPKPEPDVLPATITIDEIKGIGE